MTVTKYHEQSAFRSVPRGDGVERAAARHELRSIETLVAAIVIRRGPPTACSNFSPSSRSARRVA